MENSVVVLGGGIAGLSAAYHLQKQGIKPVIYEKEADWGGLCGNYTIDGFRFDKFVHLSFTKNEYVKQCFEQGAPSFNHPADTSNYYKGIWLTHPAQNNLYPLPLWERLKIITSFLFRKRQKTVTNYEEWLKSRYGKYFAKHFPSVYTKKYWGLPPNDLELKWIAERLYCPSLKELVSGAFKKPVKNFYYAPNLRYPKKGGYRAFLNSIRAGLDIRLNKKVVQIDTTLKEIIFSDGTKTTYTSLISTIALPELIAVIKDVPVDVQLSALNLRYTSAYLVSLGFKKEIVTPLWFYIYDADILPARVYSPSRKSPDNVPPGCSSLQAEVYFSSSGGTAFPNEQTVLKETCQKLEKMGVFDQKDLVLKDIRTEKYANVVSDHAIHMHREKVLGFLLSKGIQAAGRFGKWELMWSDQAFLDGKTEAEQLLSEIQ